MKRKMMMLQLGTVIMAFAIIVLFVNGLNVQATCSSGKNSLSKADILVKKGIITGLRREKTVKNNKQVYPKHKPYGR